MERIEYPGGSFVTGSEISAALLGYAAALGRKSSSESLNVPARDEDGNPIVAHVLVGPASQFVSLAEPGEQQELVDEDLSRRLGRLPANLVRAKQK